MGYELGILGAGNMAEAIVRGVVRAGVFKPSQIIAADVSPERREFFQSQLSVTAVESNVEAARQSRAVLLSVKPQQMQAALQSLGGVLSPGTLIISIAAGISSSFIEQQLGAETSWRIVRTMPNTPMLVGEGMAAISAGRHASADDMSRARRLFESAGHVIEVPEDKIDAITALSGSGPAYVFYLTERMSDAGVALGLAADQARILATQTVVGAGKMMQDSKDPPHELRRKVTSPGGTTQAAISLLEHRNWGETLVDAIEAAAARSKELGR